MLLPSKELRVFDEDLYYRENYLPILEPLGVQRNEMRHRVPVKKSSAKRH